jgi:hypothetical protein
MRQQFCVEHELGAVDLKQAMLNTEVRALRRTWR